MFGKLGAYFSNNFKREDDDIYDDENYAEDYELEDEEYGYSETQREEVRKPSIFNMGMAKSKQTRTIDPNTVRMQIFKPAEYDDSREIINLLKRNESVVLNLEFVSKEDGRRIVDTVSGGITALDGQIVKVTNSIFIAVPKNYQIEGGFEKRRGKMLTPEDIDKQQFSKQFKGYAVEEVDDFLEELTNDYEVLMLANKKQEDKIKELEAKIDGLSTNTNVLQETLLIAKQTADEMRRRAEEEANMIVGEAKKMLEDRAGNIDQIIEEKQNTLKFLQNEIETYKAKAERMLIEQLEVLKKIEEQQQN